MAETYYGDDESGLYDDEIEKIYRSGKIPFEKENLTDQRRLANALRLTPMPGAHVAGDVTVAANPLEFLAAGAERVAGQRQVNKINEGLTGLGEQQTAADLLAQRARMRKRMRDRPLATPDDLSGSVEAALSGIPMPKLDDEY